MASVKISNSQIKLDITRRDRWRGIDASSSKVCIKYLKFVRAKVVFSKESAHERRITTTSASAAAAAPAPAPAPAAKMEKSEMGAERAAELVSELRTNFKSGTTRSYEWRATQLKMLQKMVVQHEADIVEALRSDLSKPELEAFVSEISLTKAACTLALKELKNWMKPEQAKTSFTTFPSSAEIVPEPLGVVLVISAWNYPFLLSLDPVVGAIAAGNAVVLKPSEVAPATSSLLARLLPECLDSKAIRVVEGAVPTTTALLEQRWDKIFYTGSGRVGRIIMAAAAKHLTPVVLELGGKCPVVVDSNVDLEVAAKRIAMGKWGCNNGQACIAPDYIITPKSFASKLINALKSTLEEFFGKNPLESKDISRMVNSNHFSRVARLLDDEKVSGKIVHGGERDETSLNVAPTILLDVPEDSLMMNEEIFGPLLPIITVDNVEESFNFINSRSKPLAAYLFTKNKRVEEEFVKSVSAGGMLINDTVLHITTGSLPFGGVGESGMGSYHGKFSFDAFSHKKAVMHRGFSGESPVRYPPYTPEKQKVLRALLNGNIIGAILAAFGRSKV